MKNSEFSPNWVNKSVEKFVKKDPDVSAPEFDGIVNFNELAPEALTLVSSAGVAAPERIPLLLPHVPAISAAPSKPTHLITPGCWHLAVKSALLAGGEVLGGWVDGCVDGCEGDEGAAADGEVPFAESPPPPQAAIARLRSAASERFLMAVVRALIGWGR